MTKLNLPNKELQPIIFWFELTSGRSRAPAYVRCARGESGFVLPNEHSGTIWKRQNKSWDGMSSRVRNLLLRVPLMKRKLDPT
jgi:hypothetical protein